MKKGEVINGYRILQDFTTAGGGLSKWTFADRAGTVCFIKEFLSPTYPTPDGPGSEKTKHAKRQACEQFERHHQLLMSKLAGRSSAGGNLVVTDDFFRAGAKYYKVTQKVDVTGLKPADIAKLPWNKQRLILLTVAHSLRILHHENVVHGDLKPDNILIKEQSPDAYVAKLIDFDNSYVSGHPPTGPDELVGDQVYYSPEALALIVGREGARASDLQLRSDVFALGLIYVQYLTGSLPSFDARYRYACEAILDGTLTIPALHDPMAGLVARMLDRHPDRRPGIGEVFDTIKASRADVPTPPPVLSGPLMKKVSRSGGEGSPFRDSTSMPLHEEASPKPSDTSGPRLRGTLINRKS